MSDIADEDVMRELIENQRAEIERLTAELDEEEKTVFAAMKMIKERDAEVERLRSFICETMQLERMPEEWMDVARHLTRVEGK